VIFLVIFSDLFLIHIKKIIIMKQKKIIDSKYIKEFYEKYKKGHKVNVAKLYYQGVIGFRKAGVKYSYSFEELEEWAKCKSDPIYFIEKYCKIIDLFSQKRVNVKLYDYQKELINDFFKYRFNISIPGFNSYDRKNG